MGFADTVESILASLPDVYVIVSGYRSSAEQNALYAQGRTTAGPIVTNAKGGQSAHNVGMAIDFVPLVGGREVSAPDHPAWSNAIARARSNGGVVSGADFTLANGAHDYGHIEIKNWKVYRVPPAVPDVTSVTGSSGDGISSAPTDTPSVGGASPDGSGSFFQLDSGVVIGLAAILGVAILAWRGRGQ